MEVTVRSALVGFALIVGMALSGCAAEAPDDGPATSPATSATSGASSSTPSAATSSAAPTGATVDITLENGRFTPQGKTVKVTFGEPVTLSITADTSGELHVHDDTGTHVPFEAGTTTKEFTFPTPGTIEVEDHDSGVVVVQLEVR